MLSRFLMVTTLLFCCSEMLLAKAPATIAECLLATTGPSDPSLQQRFSRVILAAAEPQHRPSAVATDRFAGRVIASLRGKQLKADQAERLQAVIIDVLHSAGVATRRYRDVISDFKTLLSTTANFPSDTVSRLASDLDLIGREVRGPEDLPLRIE